LAVSLPTPLIVLAQDASTAREAITVQTVTTERKLFIVFP